MPRISAFYGIVITMYWELGGRHQAAHVHARYSDQEASIGIAPPAVLAGDLPPKALGLVFEWGALHRTSWRLTGSGCNDMSAWSRFRRWLRMTPMLVQVTLEFAVWPEQAP